MDDLLTKALENGSMAVIFAVTLYLVCKQFLSSMRRDGEARDATLAGISQTCHENFTTNTKMACAAIDNNAEHLKANTLVQGQVVEALRTLSRTR
jgi:hypothetical protein